jgi:uncharacterized protein YodC (DUF2158 family)
MAQFQEGDIVVLKSGGPEMTVTEVFTDAVNCKWFAGSKLHGGHFNILSLVKVEEEESDE